METPNPLRCIKPAAPSHLDQLSSSIVSDETIQQNAIPAIRDQREDDCDVAFSNYILSELRALPDSSLLRARLNRTLLEFTEERIVANENYYKT